MSPGAFSDALDVARDELAIEIADTHEQILAAQRLRHLVYCEEHEFLLGKDGIEEDEFDVHSRHILVRSRRSSRVYGTVRVVLSGEYGIGFPMQRVCDAHVLQPFCHPQLGEISRFAVTRDRAGLSSAASALMRLFLIRGIVHVSGECGLTHWCATMEPTLLRLLRTTAIHFEPVGKPIEYHGIRQPAVYSLSCGLPQIRSEHPYIWSFLTAEGTLWSDELATSRSKALLNVKEVRFQAGDGHALRAGTRPALATVREASSVPFQGCSSL